MMAAGLRATAKAVEHPPEPKVGAPVLDPTKSLQARTNSSWAQNLQEPPLTHFYCFYVLDVTDRRQLPFPTHACPGPMEIDGGGGQNHVRSCFPKDQWTSRISSVNCEERNGVLSA